MSGPLGDSQSSDDAITRKFNATNAKRIALLVVIALIAYHGVLHLTYGIKSCKWLLSDGSFHGFGDYSVWQPYGCMIHTYNKIDSRMCLRYIAYWGGKNHIVFLGDSRIRQLYYAFIKTCVPNENLINTAYPAHHDLEYKERDLKLDVRFLWHPVVNESMTKVFTQWLSLQVSERPNLIVMGSATHSIKSSNASVKALEYYRKNLTLLMPSLDKLSASSKILWALQDPVSSEKLDVGRVMITNEQIDAYNKAAMEILKYSNSNNVHIWSSARLVAQGYASDLSNPNEDGLHTNNKALNFAAQILFNMYCNDQMNYNDGTCCSDPEIMTTLQIIVFIVFTLFIVIATVILIHRKYFARKSYKWHLLVNEELDELTDNNNPRVLNTEIKSYSELMICLAKIALIMFYFFLCDRTNFFMKENKYFTRPNFFLPIAYVFALGLFFTEESSHTIVLHRDQTDELKGWMQMIILAYHYTGASQVLTIYMHIRVLVTTYLFLSGFGHFTYFWQTGDISFHRLWKVIFRINLLVVCLCLVMNRPYQFYYFVPLISFWYLVIYTTFYAIPHVTAASAEANPIQYLYMVLKFVVLFSIVTILYMSEVFFEKIFLTRPWKALFVTTDDSIKEWWFRWKIDRYSVPAGMLFAFGYHLLKKHHIIDDNHHGYLFSRGIGFIVAIASFAGIMMYVIFTMMCRNKPECNEIHPYISFIPIVSYIILRNISGLLRVRHSTFFARIGKISLELFICQYHIWLAADTHGILVLVPSYPVLNVVITSFIFICIAHEIHKVTQKMVKYAIPSDWRYTTRNIIIFLLFLIPIGIKDGMF
ncbi:N-acetylneuraminate 9-O-acetyltransferase-like [Oppia nitens]|uniref:N-acetylneuraminate 9-O-acetyltransferase-like n=1 Tax=Oppia nitens TaxID=1686743 RepID=UPI0023DB493A|nr:N-acetylneuraminate 9-O-acetyltransferase-like [Oppia nitens]